MEYLPESVMYATAEVKEVARNKFKLETVSSDSAGPNRIITFNLPENSMIDMKSLKFFADLECSGAGAGADEVFGKLPAHVSSMISRVEVYINGVQVQQGASEYSTISQIMRLGCGNIDKDNSIDRCLSHSYITDNEGNDDETICVSEWQGFLNEASTRYLNTGLVGQIQIRLTWAGNHVLVPKQFGVPLGTDLTGAGITNAAAIKYSVSQMYFTCDTITLDPMYNAMLRKRLESGGLELNYKEYYSFQLDGITGGAGATSASTRFSLSSGCINRCYAVYRDANYTSVGKRSHLLPNAVGVAAYQSNALRFRSYSGDTKKVGNARWQWSINNVKYPQMLGTWMDGLADVGYAQDKVSHYNNGTLITSKESFNDGKFVYPLLLELPTGRGVSVQSGYNSRGINTQMVFQSQAQTVPPAAGQVDSGVISSFVVCETTAKLLIALGRDLAVQF